MLKNLEALGVKVEKWDCFSPKDAYSTISLFRDGEFMIVGMDAFHIPWNQFYQTFHGLHYFIAQNAKTETFLCIDPTYNKKNEQIARWEITSHTYEICRISRGAKKPFQIEALDEAREIVRTHSNTRSVLLSQIDDCVEGEQENIVLLAKYVDAMIGNRCLYRFFLENQSLPYGENHLFLNRDFFLEWKAVKNGLYKAAISRKSKRIIDDVCDILTT